METKIRLKYLETRCKTVKVMKECDYMKTRAKNKKRNILKTPLKIRDALYGGHTSPSVLHKDCFEKGKIYYVDFVSLYPSIQYNEFYPVGDPTVVIDNNRINMFLNNEMKKDINERQTGFLKCTVLPPRNLLFPMLPTRIDGKLLFSLCCECSRLKNHKVSCNHSSDERKLSGT